MSGKGLVRSYMRDAWGENGADEVGGGGGARAAAAGAAASLATGAAGARGGPQAAARARDRDRDRDRDPHAERWKRVNQAADEARARARKLDLEQQKEPCQATRRKAIVAALQYNERLVELHATAESAATVLGSGNGDTGGVGVTGGKRVSKSSRPPPPDIREMMDVVKVMCDQVGELLRELEGACRAQPDSDPVAGAGADRCRQHP